MSSPTTALSPLDTPFRIRFVGPSGPASSVRRHRLAVAARRVALALGAAAAILLAGIGFSAVAANPVGPDNVVRTDPVRGEFRLGPGNAMPPGYVIPLDSDQGLSDPVEWRPSLVPLDGGISRADQLPDTFRVTPPGRVPAA
jgi:hypothetical protein